MGGLFFVFLKKFNRFLPINRKTSTRKDQQVGTIRNLKTVSSLAVSQKSVRERKELKKIHFPPFLLSINYSVLLQLLLSVQAKSERNKKRIEKKDPFLPSPFVY
jgi:DNA replication protein DnaD